MGNVNAIVAGSTLDTFEGPTNSKPAKAVERVVPKKNGFQPRTAVMQSGAKVKPTLTNLKVDRPMPGKIAVTAREGFLTGTLEGGNELVVDIYQVNEKFRGRKLGQALIAAAVDAVKPYSLCAELDYSNGHALREANGDATQTPFGRAADALGFEFAEKDGNYFIWIRRR